MASSEIPISPKHNFDPAKFTVARLEETGEVAPLYADLVSTYRPVNSQELFALERMALCQQAMLRAARLESGLFTSCMNESFGPEGAPSLPFRQEMAEGIEITRDLNRNFILADGFQLLARQGNSIPLFLRYQVQAERLYRRAVEEFERLKKLRPELQFEPNPDAGPPPAETPKPQSDEPLPASGQAPSNGHKAPRRPPSARCRRPVAPQNSPYFPQHGSAGGLCRRCFCKRNTRPTFRNRGAARMQRDRLLAAAPLPYTVV
jgi:hypothetical protein